LDPDDDREPQDARDRRSRYLALGDSVTFGYQEPQVVPAPNYHNPSRFLGYPEQLGAELHLRVANAACPGETSASLINASAQSNGCENAYRKNFPLHVRYKGAQLAYGISFLGSHREVKLVSLMVGANDLFPLPEDDQGRLRQPCGTERGIHQARA
jgi:lysophospholipase L1-like esterase